MHQDAAQGTGCISIHALREEGDPMLNGMKNMFGFYFYPRPPRGGRPAGPAAAAAHNYFYPRPPRGGRREDMIGRIEDAIFLSTPSARRATSFVVSFMGKQLISIHALREEGDCNRWQAAPAWSISIHALREEGDMLY